MLTLNVSLLASELSKVANQTGTNTGVNRNKQGVTMNVSIFFVL